MTEGPYWSTKLYNKQQIMKGPKFPFRQNLKKQGVTKEIRDSQNKNMNRKQLPKPFSTR